MFAAAVRLRSCKADTPRPYRIPGGKAGIRILFGAGILACVATMFCSFLPPSGVSGANAILGYYAFIVGGFAVMLAIPFILYARSQKNKLKRREQMENVVLATFTEESQAYQAYSVIKNDALNDACSINQIALIKKQDGKLIVKENYNDGSQTADDTFSGGLIGAIVGVIAGPIGMLLGASIGMLIGSAIDIGDASQNASYLENAAMKLGDGTTALVMLAVESDDAELDSKLSPFKASVTRYEAAVMQEEVEETMRMHDELARQTRENLRKERSDARKARLSELREKAKERLNL